MANKTSGDKEWLERFKEEAAREVGVDLSETARNTSRQNGSVGGQMVKKMIEHYKSNME